jgi:hypothetical protein
MSGYLADVDFGDDGVFIDSSVPMAPVNNNRVAIDANNKIVTLGTSYSAYIARIALKRLNGDGTFDSTFQTYTATLPGGMPAYSVSLVIDSAGFIYVGGYSVDDNYFIGKFAQNGGEVSTFGDNGFVVRKSLGASSSVLVSLALTSTGELVVGGNNAGQNGFLAVHSSATGALVAENNVQLLDNPAQFPSLLHDIAIDSTDNIMVALGYTTSGQYGLQKYDLTCTRVSAFSQITSPNFVNTFDSNKPLKISTGANGTIIISYTVGWDYGLVIYSSAGALESTVRSNFNVGSTPYSISTATSLMVDANGKIVVGGYYTIGSNEPFYYAVHTYSSSGVLDANLSIQGSYGAGVSSTLSEVTIDLYGNLILTGNSQSSWPVYFGVAKYVSISISSSTCFPKGTKILTDSGYVPIELIDSDVHTINQKAIVGIVQTVLTSDNYLVCFDKNCLGDNVPSCKTVMSSCHKVYHDGQEFLANNCLHSDFLNKYCLNSEKRVHKVQYRGETMYNVLMENYETIDVNNMKCETLHPKHSISTLFVKLQKLNAKEQMQLIKKHNQFYLDSKRRALKK